MERAKGERGREIEKKRKNKAQNFSGMAEAKDDECRTKKELAEREGD